MYISEKEVGLYPGYAVLNHAHERRILYPIDLVAFALQASSMSAERNTAHFMWYWIQYAPQARRVESGSLVAALNTDCNVDLLNISRVKHGSLVAALDTDCNVGLLNTTRMKHRSLIAT